MNKCRRSLFLWAALLVAGAAAAQDWPAKPVRVVVPNSAGSLSDLVARLVFGKVSESLGQQFFIDNRPGAGGSIGAELVAKAPPDGYTLLMVSDGTVSVNPFIYSKLGYDPLRDFAPVSLVTKLTQALYVNNSIGAKTLDEFVRLARANPGKLTYASGGNGHATHLAMELFLWKANLQLVHVPYKGTGPALQAAAAGEVSAVMIATSIAKPFVASGKLIALGTAGASSPDVLPGVPPLGSRFPGSELLSWQAVVAPARTPPEIVRALHGAIARALGERDVSERLKAGGTDAVPSTPAELAELIREDYARNGELVKRLHLKVD
jgi:tripartite-type tricarboxylate transporter receptor subunit TctC